MLIFYLAGVMYLIELIFQKGEFVKFNTFRYLLFGQIRVSLLL